MNDRLTQIHKKQYCGLQSRRISSGTEKSEA